MDCSHDSTPRIFDSFVTKLAIFHFLHFVIIQVFQPNSKPPLGFDYKLQENFCWPWVSFQILFSQNLAVFNATFNFSSFLKFFKHFLGFSNLKSHINSSRV